jgi:hypothetical protein
MKAMVGVQLHRFLVWVSLMAHLLLPEKGPPICYYIEDWAGLRVILHAVEKKIFLHLLGIEPQFLGLSGRKICAFTS